MNQKIEYCTFAIDTDSYAGNFERELCAYITGQLGECEVGDKFAEIFKKEISSDLQEKFEDLILDIADHNGCRRPCSIIKTPGNEVSNSVGIFLNDNPTEEMIKIMKERSENFLKASKDISYFKNCKFKIVGFRLIEKYVYEVEKQV